LLAAAFLIGYGLVRFLLEFARQPDAQLGLVLGPFSMGQLLSATMIAVGLGLVVLLVWRGGRRPANVGR
jgi:phosphatidylglycerol:prolipoprotein diacylglycerol transferase